MKRCLAVSIVGLVFSASPALAEKQHPEFDTEKDLISLHYDHAPDKDDGQSAAADRTVLQTMFGVDWINKHAVAVSGAYGKNAKSFNPKSDAVMDVCFGECGGWLAGHTNRKEVVDVLTRRWTATIEAGGDVWVKEGGQSDITADVVRQIQERSPKIDTAKRIHVVQHSNWNERQTTDADLAYVKRECNYLRIHDGNRFLNKKGGDNPFEKAATHHKTFGPAWQAAFVYYPPKHRLDFSDTCELMHILGLGELGIDEFRKRFLENGE